jgi:hypothetical protein
MTILKLLVLLLRLYELIPTHGTLFETLTQESCVFILKWPVNVCNMYGGFKRPSFVTYSFVFHFHFWLISGHLNSAARFLQDVHWNMS